MSYFFSNISFFWYQDEPQGSDFLSEGFFMFINSLHTKISDYLRELLSDAYLIKLLNY